METGMRRAARWGLIFGGVLLLFVAVGLWHPAHAAAASFTVTTTSDDSTDPNSLPYAIGHLEAGTNTITFSVSGTIALVNGGMLIDQNVTIDATGQSIILDGLGNTSIFGIFQGAHVSLIGLTMQNGSSSDGGGAILNQGILTVQKCVFNQNNGFFAGGGAISNLATLVVLDSTFTGNTAGIGGAINTNNGPLTVSGSTFQSNTAMIPVPLGARKSSPPRIADGFYTSGGAIFVCSCSSASITNSTFTGNSATTNGGAIITEGFLGLVNVTVSGNSANSGGGIFVSTVDSGTLTAVDTLIAGNTLTGTGGSGPDVNGPFQDTSKSNLIGDGTTTGLVNGTNGNQVGTTASPINPLISVLGSYGGSTQTFALLPGSPAIDTGTDTGCGVPLTPPVVTALSASITDQRGVPRPQLAHCDIGAFETQGFTLTPSGTPQSAAPNAAFAQPLGVTVTPVHAGDPVQGGVIAFAVTPVSGAGATLSAPSQTIDATGKASVSATANGTVGAYTAAASTVGAGLATFNLANVVITITPETLPDGTAGTTYPSQTLGVTGGTTPYTFTLLSGSLPPGLTLQSNGVIAGKPTTGGAFDFTVQAKDAAGITATKGYTVNIRTLVSLVVTYNGSSTATIKVGQVAPFVATEIFSDNTQVVVTTQATWSSDAPTNASVVATTGSVTGLVPTDTATLHITATADGLSGEAIVTVVAPSAIGNAPQPAPASRPGVTTNGSGSTKPTPNPAPTGR